MMSHNYKFEEFFIKRISNGDEVFYQIKGQWYQQIEYVLQPLDRSIVTEYLNELAEDKENFR